MHTDLAVPLGRLVIPERIRERLSEKLGYQVIANEMKQSLPEQEIASLPPTPRNDSSCPLLRQPLRMRTQTTLEQPIIQNPKKLARELEALAEKRNMAPRLT